MIMCSISTYVHLTHTCPYRSLNSSGFEHVFVGESRDGTVIGLHNWLQFYLQEKLGNIDYRGHFRRGTVSSVFCMVVVYKKENFFEYYSNII